MDMSSLYFVAYAAITTVSGIVIAQAQYTHPHREGKSINDTVLKIAFGNALAMWAAVALSPTPLTLQKPA